jgi:endonuclease-8
MACQVLAPDEAAAKAAAQGPDPLDPTADPDSAWSAIHSSRRSIAELLMDQRVLAGVGNVYRCEVLFRRRVNPAVAGNRLKRATWNALWGDLAQLMPIAVATGRIVTRDAEVHDRPAARSGRSKGYHVYRRDGMPCERCRSRVRTRLIAGRNLFWCGNCQRRS